MEPEISSEQVQAMKCLVEEHQNNINESTAVEAAVGEKIEAQKSLAQEIKETIHKNAAQEGIKHRKEIRDMARRRQNETTGKAVEVEKKTRPKLNLAAAAWATELETIIDGWQALNTEQFKVEIETCRKDLATIDGRRQEILQAFSRQTEEILDQRSYEDGRALQRHRDFLSSGAQELQDSFGRLIAAHDQDIQAVFSDGVQDARNLITWADSRLEIIKNEAVELLGSRMASAAEIIDREAQQQRGRQLSNPIGEPPPRAQIFEELNTILSGYSVELRSLLAEGCSNHYLQLIDDLAGGLQRRILEQRDRFMNAVADLVASDEARSEQAEQEWREVVAGIERKVDLGINEARQVLLTEMENLSGMEYRAWMVLKGELSVLAPLEINHPLTSLDLGKG